jgi:hypothetical protein
VAGVEPGLTYYWRVDEVDADGVVTQGDVWSFTTLSTKAAEPLPHAGAKSAPVDGALTWTPGYGAQTHTVYFGTSIEEVTNATGGTPQAAPTYTPASPLAKGTTYYWRVDEFDGTNTYTGPVWSFTTITDITITDPDLVGWWTFDEGGTTKALDFSGHGNDGTYGGGVTLVDGVTGYAVKLNAGYIAVDGVVDDIKTTNITLSAWIKTTQSGEGNVFAANDSASDYALMFGIQGGNPYRWDQGDQQFPPAINDNQWHLLTYVRDGATGYIYVDGTLRATYSTSFSWSSPTVTRWSIGQEWDDSTPSDFYNGLVDDVRIYTRPLTADEVMGLMRVDPTLAWKPSPSNGATPDVIKAGDGLTWSAGDNAKQHDVYFGTDEATVKSADASDQTGVYRGRQAEASFAPAETLGWGSGPYYWRIDEVQEDGTVSTGAVWNFSVAAYLTVDDMEAYTDKEGEEIYTTWVDGFTDGLSNSTVGLMTAVGGTFGETTIVHGGRQSMPMTYDNSKAPFFSETVQTFAPVQDWTAYGVDTLTVFWRGNAGNGADNLYVTVEDSAGKQATVTNTDTDVKVTAWVEWKIPLSSFTGVNLAKVKKLYVGVGNRKAPAMGGAGTVYVDDIRLTKPPAAVSGPLDLRIEDGANDAEEHLADGAMDITSTDLEFPYEDNADPSATDPQLNALRFVLPLAQGAQISKAYLEFEVDENKGNDKPVNVIIEAQLVADAPAIADTASNLSSRAAWTKAKVKWTVPMGLTADTKFQSPDISAILNELVNQAGWMSGNAVLLAIRDDPDAPSTGLRCVESFDGEATAAPLLHIE